MVSIKEQVKIRLLEMNFPQEDCEPAAELFEGLIQKYGFRWFMNNMNVFKELADEARAGGNPRKLSEVFTDDEIKERLNAATRKSPS